MTHIIMRKLDPETGEEIDTTQAEKAEALAELRSFIGRGKVELMPSAIADLERMGITKEVLESWLMPKN